MTGIVAPDYTQILSDLGRTVSWEQATKTQDPISGDETVSYANAININVVFFRNDQRFSFDREGIVEQGDAYILADVTLALAREDKITIDNQKFIIQNITRRHMVGVQMLDYCILYLLE